jgi:hypothetical protein
MKKGIVRQLLKKQSLDPEQLQNYRPISNLPFLSKVVEKVVASRISTHMDTHHLHDSSQSAYHAHHGTETVLVRVTNDICHVLDEHQGVFWCYWISHVHLIQLTMGYQCKKFAKMLTGPSKDVDWPYGIFNQP